MSTGSAPQPAWLRCAVAHRHDSWIPHLSVQLAAAGNICQFVNTCSFPTAFSSVSLQGSGRVQCFGFMWGLSLAACAPWKCRSAPLGMCCPLAQEVLSLPGSPGMHEELIQLRPSQQYVHLTFSWKSMVAVWTAWGKSWLWVKTHSWCCPECDHTHMTLESNLLLRTPFPSTTSLSLLANHLLLHVYLRATQPPFLFLPQCLVPAVTREPEQLSWPYSMTVTLWGCCELLNHYRAPSFCPSDMWNVVDRPFFLLSST